MIDLNDDDKGPAEGVFGSNDYPDLNLPEISELTNEDKGLADGIFVSSNYSEPSLPRKRDRFLPWHKPRKQYVRNEQWCREIKSMFEGFQPEDKTFRYLGLPGEDLLDLRFFHEEICVPNDLKLKYLGFNNDGNSSAERGSDLHVSLAEVNQLDYVSEESLLMPDNFCTIADKKSIAYSRSKDIGPFDVINIDLCDGIGKQSPEFLETHYSTLKRLINLQSRRKNPWLLFITTRTGGTKQFNDQVFDTLKKIYTNNLSDCPSFKIASSTLHNIGNIQCLDDAIKTGKGKADVFLIALSKWIASIGVGLIPKFKVEVQSAYGYKVHGIEDFLDMTSISFKITPTDIGNNDIHNLAKGEEDTLDECELAVHALKTVLDQKDVDKILSENLALKQEMTELSGGLLEKARYDRAKYYKWAEKY